LVGSGYRPGICRKTGGKRREKRRNSFGNQTRRSTTFSNRFYPRATYFIETRGGKKNPRKFKPRRVSVTSQHAGT